MPYPTAALPPRPSLSLLSDRAKALRKAHRRGSPEAIERVRMYHPGLAGAGSAGAASAELSLRDAQLVVAREHGFDNWTELVRNVEARRLAGDAEQTTFIESCVPLLAVSDMQRSLDYYRRGLGFEMTRSWTPEGEVRWCRLERDGAALMLQQFYTEGHDARVFEGRRGAGAVFIWVGDRAAPTERMLDASRDRRDDDGYDIRDLRDLARSASSRARFIPALEVSNLERSVAFYHDVLGFDDVSGAGETRRLKRDDVDLVLSQESTPVLRRGQGLSLNYGCHDAVGFYRDVTARGGAMSEPFVGNRMWVAPISDPDGWQLSFQSPTRDPEETRFSESEA